ncbi:DUF4505 family protein [Leptospira sp. WS92.C1]
MSQRRTYFYHLDAQGRLFHETSELKDPDFLDFFISRIRKNETRLHPEYPYLSVCAGEWNFIQPTTSIFIFRKLETENLYYSPSLFVPFEPGRLGIFKNSLVHPAPLKEWGCFSSAFLMEISKQIVQKEEGLFFLRQGQEFPILKIED